MFKILLVTIEMTQISEISLVSLTDFELQCLRSALLQTTFDYHFDSCDHNFSSLDADPQASQFFPVRRPVLL